MSTDFDHLAKSEHSSGLPHWSWSKITEGMGKWPSNSSKHVKAESLSGVRGNDRAVVRHTIWMRPIATPIACFVVCVVGTMLSPATAAESIKMPLRGRQTRVGERTVYRSAHWHHLA